MTRRGPLAAILDEIARLRDPRTLWFGVVSGYGLTAAFAVLLGVAVATGAVPWHWIFAVLIGAKLVTNTLAWIGLRTNRFALELGGLNVAIDAVVMTGAVWATGDIASPLCAVYTIEVTVLALLTNLTTAVLIGGFAMALFLAMVVLVATGVLPRFPSPVEWSGHGAGALLVSSLLTGFVIGVPTFYVAGILRRLRQNERRLEARTHELVDAGKQKAQFMANVTHELRTPLQGVMGLSELVARGIYGPATERQQGAMAEVKASARRLLTLIDDLLQLATHDAGKLDVQLEDVDLVEVLPSAVATAQWLLAGKQLRIAHELAAPAETPWLLATDRGKLNQVILNLLANAIKFTPDGGSIVLRARPADGGAAIEVEDTGIGIPPDELGRIFEEFHQVDGSMSREYGGVGLGLTLVRRLLVLLGGTITVASTVGQGSTFRVWLPPRCPASATGGAPAGG